MSTTDAAALPDIKSLWNFGDPASTEAKFRELLPLAGSSGNTDYHAQLLTQIARTNSLRSKFAEAHELLDRAEALTATDKEKTKLAHVRCLLERGRSYNSAGEKASALPIFKQAYEEAAEIDEMQYAIDALHMIAIAETEPAKQVEWNLKAIEIAKSDPKAAVWLHALYNNIGESYASLDEYDTAYMYFDKISDLLAAKGREADMYLLKDKARMKRLAGKTEESLAIIEPVFSQLESKSEDDGWIREELAEALYAIGKKDEAKPHFVKAYGLLQNDGYCKQHETAKLARLKKMAA